MGIDEILQNEQALFLVRSTDLQEFAIKLANQILAGQSQPTVTQENERPLSQSEAVQFLGKSRQTLITWRKKGVIKGYKLGGRVYYKSSELVSALEKFK